MCSKLMIVRPMIAALFLLTASCHTGTSDVENDVVVHGTIRAGAELGEVKRHCAEGLYLVAAEGQFLTGQTSILLLRVPGVAEQAPAMFSDRQYVGQRVEAVAQYPTGQAYCEALICACEEYILIKSIKVQP